MNYNKYIKYLTARVHSFLGSPTRGVAGDSAPAPSWVAEQLLCVLTQIPSNVTPAKMTDMIVAKWRDVVHELRPPKKGEAFVCTVQACETFRDSRNPVLRVSPPSSKQCLRLWLHESMVQFVGTTILAAGRQLRMIASDLIHDTFMLPVRAIVIEMGLGRKSDYLWVKRQCQPNMLAQLRAQSEVDAIMVKVIDKQDDCLFVKDDSVKTPMKVELDSKVIDYSCLLRIDDVIVIWRPELRGDPLRIEFGEKTAILRLPMLHREEMDCRDAHVNGVVDTISYSVNSGEWLGCQVDVLETSGTRRTIVFPRSTLCEQKMILRSVRSGHFIYLFHLLTSSDNKNILTFTDESVLYNVNSFVSLVESMVVRPVPISLVAGYLSGVIRAVIIEFDVSLAEIHIDCGCVLQDEHFCPKCGAQVDGRQRQEMLLRFLLDDGSLDCLTAYGTPSTVAMFKYDAQDWVSQPDFQKTRAIKAFIGSEWIFFVSRSAPLEFGEKDGPLWRIDNISRGTDETPRTVRSLLGTLESGDQYIVGTCGTSMFTNSIHGPSDFLGCSWAP